MTQKSFLTQKIVWPQNLFGPTFFWIEHFEERKLLYKPHVCVCMYLSVCLVLDKTSTNLCILVTKLNIPCHFHIKRVVNCTLIFNLIYSNILYMALVQKVSIAWAQLRFERPWLITVLILNVQFGLLVLHRGARVRIHSVGPNQFPHSTYSQTELSSTLLKPKKL